MDAIAERCRAIMQWLLILGLLAAWGAIDNSPRVVDEARAMISSCLSDHQALGLQSDPLTDLPPAPYTALAQFRHEFLRYPDAHLPAQRALQRVELEKMTMETITLCAKQTLAQIDRQPVPGLRESFVIAPVRSRLAKLESWHQKSGLSSSATLAEVEAELRSRLPIPGTEQTIPLDQCMFFIALGIAGLELMLTSLLATLRGLPRGEPDYSLVFLHRAPLGPLLTTAWLVFPVAAWIVQAMVRAAAYDELPGASAVLLAGVLILTTMGAIRSVFATRRALLRGEAAALAIVRAA